MIGLARNIRRFAVEKRQRQSKTVAVEERVSQLIGLTSALKQQQALRSEQLLEATALLTSSTDIKGHSKLANSKEAELYNVLVSLLLSADNSVELLKLLAMGQGRFQRKPTLSRFEEYFCTRIDSLNGYQNSAAAFWLSFYQHPNFLMKLLSKGVAEQVGILPESIREEAAILLSYAQLIHQPIQVPSKELVLYKLLPKDHLAKHRDNLVRETKELQLFINPQSPVTERDVSASIKIRSQLETQLECALSALKIPFHRQVEVFGCYTVDLKCGNLLVDMLGPSHYLHWGQPKGNEIVRAKLIQRHGLQYRTISHTAWSKLNGIRKQLDFTQELLS